MKNKSNNLNDNTSDSKKNVYANSPSGVNEQIQILQSRGLIIDDYEFAKDFLEEVYFHRFLSYSVPFLVKGNSHRYQAGTKFSTVVKVYEFDSQLRLLILGAIEKIEISVRTQFINLSWKYGPHFYLSHKLFRDHKLLNDSIERIQYQMKASNDLLVNEYFSNYHDPQMPPVWSAVELVTIGQLSKWLMNLKHEEDKDAVAKRYKIHYSILQAILDNLTLIRNSAAHHTRVWNQHYNFTCIIDDRHQSISHALCDGNKIYGVLLLITYILKTLGMEQPFFNRLTELINIYEIDIAEMGFPNTWQQHFDDVIHGK